MSDSPTPEQLEHRNYMAPNFLTKDGQLYLVRCYACGPEGRGRENWGPAVATGTCAWCGWPSEDALTPEQADQHAGTGEYGGGPGKYRGEK